MDLTEEAIRDPAGTAVPQELLEEMIWFFRVEDASAWNYSILGLTAVVVSLSLFLLGRNIHANRNRKTQPQERNIPENLHLDEARTKNNSLNNVTEMLLSGNSVPDGNQFQMGTESKEKDIPMVLFPYPSETES